MKNLKKILIAVLLLCACFVSTGKVSAATLKAPKITLTKESEYTAGTIDVAYVKNASTYQVWRSTDQKKWTQIGLLHVEGTYLDETGVPNTTYYYRVKACNLKNKCGKYSNIVSKKATLNAPDKLQTYNIGSYVGLGWIGDSNATGYQIKKSTDDKKYGKTQVIEYSSYSDDAVEKNKTYYYKVRSYKKINKKNYYSKWVTIKVVNKIPTVKGLRAVATDNGITLFWKGQESRVEILRSTKKNGEYVNISEYDYSWPASVSKSSYDSSSEVYVVDSGLKTNTTYYYKVRYIYTVNGKEKKSKQFTISAKTLKTSKVKKLVIAKAKELANDKYSDGTPVAYSKSELIEQLILYGYSKKAAKYGVEKAKINFKVQALNFAKNFVGSESRLKVRLKEKGFSNKEINYAVKNAKLDYDANARVYDRSSLEGNGVSKQFLVEELTNALFTKKQVNNGSKNVNYNLQAVLKAKAVMNYSLYSEKALKEALVESYGFTKAEAKYAIKNANINFISSAVKYAKENWKNNDTYNYGEAYFFDYLTNNNVKFTDAEAKKILSLAKINYNKKALAAAKSYINSEYGYSEQSMRDNLSYRHFTKANINYAIKKGKFNFNKEALKDANRWAKDGYSRADIENNLTSNGYTSENVAYALKKVNKNLMKANAVTHANYIANNYYSTRSELRNDLIGSGYKYTKTEANYAIANSGIDFEGKLVEILNSEINSGFNSVSSKTLTDYKSYYEKLEFTKAEIESAMKQTNFEEELKNSLAQN